jgi:hypothetical protein
MKGTVEGVNQKKIEEMKKTSYRRPFLFRLWRERERELVGERNGQSFRVKTRGSLVGSIHTHI